MMLAIRLMIVDDHAFVRDGTKAYFREDPLFSVVGEAGNGQEALERIAVMHPKPDVVIFDIQMPIMNGSVMAKELHKRFPKVRLVALTSFNATTFAPTLLRSGVTGFASKDSSAAELKMVVTTVFNGGFVLPDQIMPSSELQMAELNIAKLTPKEREVLKALLDTGGADQYLADLLRTNVRNVGFHLANIYKKLDVVRNNLMINSTVWLMLINSSGQPQTD